MVAFSENGEDDVYLSEFDIVKGTFVKTDPFHFDKIIGNRIRYLDRDTVLVASYWNGDSMTRAWYPRQVKLIKRGQTAEDAPIVFSADEGDFGISMRPLSSSRVLFTQRYTLYQSKYVVWKDRSEYIDLPDTFLTAKLVGASGAYLFFILRDTSVFGENDSAWPAGSLVRFDLNTFIKDQTHRIEPVYIPSTGRAVQSVHTSRNYIWVHLLDNVRSRILRFSKKRPKAGYVALDLPTEGTIRIVSNSPHNNKLLFSYSDFLTPTQVYYLDNDADPNKLKPTLVRAIDPAPGLAPEDFVTEQRWTQSADGTSIPYFIVRHRQTEFNGKKPYPTFCVRRF